MYVCMLYVCMYVRDSTNLVVLTARDLHSGVSSRAFLKKSVLFNNPTDLVDRVTLGNVGSQQNAPLRKGTLTCVCFSVRMHYMVCERESLLVVFVVCRYCCGRVRLSSDEDP
jgi:hypothetical protein